MSRHSAYSSRKIRLLRFILRRRPCLLLVFLQIVIFVVFFGAAIILMNINANRSEDYSRLKHENEILDHYSNFSNFFKCKYYPPTNYDIGHCGWALDEASYIIRFHRRRVSTKICASRFEMISCNLKYPQQYTRWRRLVKKKRAGKSNISYYRSCAGFSGTPVGSYGISSQAVILAPQIGNLDVKLGIILRPKDFIIRCPVCIASSSFESNKKSHCIRYLKTLREGWPQIAANCDESEFHPVREFCKVYDKTLVIITGREENSIIIGDDYDQDFD